jgi:SAM-dependent methyltransferase
MTDAVDPADWRDLNHAWWEERAPRHAADGFYDLESGAGLGVRDFEWELIGEVDGLDVIHPQCHLGTDTLSFARRGARTVGLDFSAAAIDGATRFAESEGLAAATEWVVSDVYDSVAAVGGRSFDIVYTGFGAICWLPDLDRWAGVMDDLCRPGGTLHLHEFHPLQEIFADDDLTVVRDYFDAAGKVYDEPGSYASADADTEANLIVDHVHAFGEVMTAVLDKGFVIRSFREYDFTLFARWPWLDVDDEGVYRMPSGHPKIPLMYTLVADKPA